MKIEKKCILVVDDEEEIRFLLETKFFKLGYQVETAATGLQASQKIRSGKSYELVICDLKMPKMDGVEFYQELIKHQPKSKFLLVTGFPEKDKLTNAVKKGIVHILIKPVKHSEIIAKIQELIGPPEKES